MNLIERYLYAIKKYLPEEIREDVGKVLPLPQNISKLMVLPVQRMTDIMSI